MEKSTIKYTITLTSFIFVATLSAYAQMTDSRPNVLMILSDDHSAAHLGCYGNSDIVTPNLDKFASEGMRFNRAYVTSPQSAPSRASVMTGRSPIGIDMTRFYVPLDMEFRTFGEDLRADGYYTGVSVVATTSMADLAVW